MDFSIHKFTIHSLSIDCFWFHIMFWIMLITRVVAGVHLCSWDVSSILLASQSTSMLYLADIKASEY